MDPNQQPHQPNPPSGAPVPQKGPLDSNQAAELIRQQLNAIYSSQDSSNVVSNQTQQQQASSHFNPYQRVQESSNEVNQTPPAQAMPAPVVQQAPQPTTPYYNPYHKPAPTGQTQTQPMPDANQQLPGAAPGESNYRNNYSTFTIPGQPQAAPHTPEPVAAQTNPAIPPEVYQQMVQNQVVTGSVTADKPSMGDLKQSVIDRVQSATKKKKHSKLKPLIVSLAIGLAFLGLNYNEIAIAQVKQYISPGDSISTPVILDPTITENVGKENKIIIPKINLDVPVIYDIKGYDEAQIQEGLERGVVHYGNTALPGQKGNNVIVGHSSNNYFNSGEYKFAFVLLFRLEQDDTFILHYGGKRYIYKVFNKQVIEPNDFSLIQQTEKPIVTLITCTPPGTNWKRLVIQAKQISPDPTEAKESTATNEPQNSGIVPGNSPSFWSEIFNSIF